MWLKRGGRRQGDRSACFHRLFPRFSSPYGPDGYWRILYVGIFTVVNRGAQLKCIIYYLFAILYALPFPRGPPLESISLPPSFVGSVDSDGSVAWVGSLVVGSMWIIVISSRSVWDDALNGGSVEKGETTANHDDETRREGDGVGFWLLGLKVSINAVDL